MRSQTSGEPHGSGGLLHVHSFGRVHQTLRVTAAMEAGAANYVWSVDEIVELLH